MTPATPPGRTAAHTTAVQRPSRVRRWLHGDESWKRQETAGRLAAAVAIALASVAFKLLVVRTFGGELGYLGFVTAVILSAWLAGRRGGIVATLICALAEVVFIVDSGGAFTPSVVLGIALFVFDGILVTAITSALSRAILRERQAWLRSNELLEAQRVARESSDRDRVALAGLQTVTASLAGAVTPRDVADAILDRGLAVLGAAAGGVSRLDAASGVLELIASRGYPNVDPTETRYSLDRPTHVRDAAFSGQPVLLGDIEEWHSRYPDSPPRSLGDGSTDAAIAVLPLAAEGRVLGTAVFRFDHPVAFDEGPGELARRLAEQGAQAFDRALAYDAERRARLDLERGQRRLSFLAKASDRLSVRQDIAAGLQEVAELAVPELADWCLIELADVQRLALAVAPAGARAALERDAPDRVGPLGLWLTPATDTSGVTVTTVRAGWPGLGRDPRVRSTLDALATQSLLVALVTAPDGDAAGSVVLGRTGGDGFDPGEVALARDLVQRVSTAASRARLFVNVARFKATVDESADAVFMFDPASLRLTYVNRGGCELVGHDREQLMEQGILQVQPAFVAGPFRRLIDGRSEGGGGSVAYTSLLERADGREVPIEVFAQEVTLGDGTTSVIVTARDMSDRIDVQARLTRIAGDERRQAAELRAVIHAMGEGILVVGPDGLVSLANEAALRIIGGEMPRDLADLRQRLGLGLDVGAQAGGDGAEGGAGDGGPAVDERATPGSDPRVIRLGDGRWIETAIYPADLGPSLSDEGTSSIVVVRDVTRAKEADAAREAFIGVLSHELRTPVTTIFGYSKVLQRPIRRADQAELLNDIEVEADRLYRIVEDLLALSRVEGGISIEGEPILVQHLAEPLIELEAHRWTGIRFELNLPPGLPAAYGERTYIEQVLRNLVSNAGKYSAAGSVVTVSATSTPSEIVVRVLDRGIGIQADEAARLFELYYRSPKSARRASGAGIGLYVSRGLVTAMGGRIWARPRRGGGSEFGFSLPRYEMEAGAARERAGTLVDGSRSQG